MAEPLNLVWWTLPVELSFYLILAAAWIDQPLVDWRVMLCRIADHVVLAKLGLPESANTEYL